MRGDVVGGRRAPGRGRRERKAERDEVETRADGAPSVEAGTRRRGREESGTAERSSRECCWPRTRANPISTLSCDRANRPNQTFTLRLNQPTFCLYRHSMPRGYPSPVSSDSVNASARLLVPSRAPVCPDERVGACRTTSRVRVCVGMWVSGQRLGSPRRDATPIDSATATMTPAPVAIDLLAVPPRALRIHNWSSITRSRQNE